MQSRLAVPRGKRRNTEEAQEALVFADVLFEAAIIKDVLSRHGYECRVMTTGSGSRLTKGVPSIYVIDPFLLDAGRFMELAGKAAVCPGESFFIFLESPRFEIPGSLKSFVKIITRPIDPDMLGIGLKLLRQREGCRASRSEKITESPDKGAGLLKAVQAGDNISPPCVSNEGNETEKTGQEKTTEVSPDRDITMVTSEKDSGARLPEETTDSQVECRSPESKIPLVGTREPLPPQPATQDVSLTASTNTDTGDGSSEIKKTVLTGREKEQDGEKNLKSNVRKVSRYTVDGSKKKMILTEKGIMRVEDAEKLGLIVLTDDPPLPAARLSPATARKTRETAHCPAVREQEQHTRPVADKDEKEKINRVQTTCPVCRATFERFSPDMKKLIEIGLDSDLVPVYSNYDITLYEIVVCPACFFAAREEDFINPSPRLLTEAAAERVARMVTGGKTDFTLPRNPVSVAKSYRLALISYRRVRGHAFIGELETRLARVFRNAGEVQQEYRVLRDALRNFHISLHTTKDYDEIRTGYLGCLYLSGNVKLKLGQYRAAVETFNTLLCDSRLSSNPRLLHLTRLGKQKALQRERGGFVCEAGHN